MENKLVMIVEDDPINRELAVNIVNHFDYPTCVVANGEEALEKIKEEKPALVLMDLSLPVMDGWETTKNIRVNEEYNDIVIIALTAHAMRGDREQAIKIGCNEYLSKPYNPGLLCEVLHKYLG